MVCGSFTETANETADETDSEMDFDFRTFKNQSLVTFKKGSAAQILVGLIVLFVNVSCKTQAPTSEKVEAPAAALEPIPVQKSPEQPLPEPQWEKALTRQGKNESPRFSPDGKRMLFVSRERSEHKHRQLYEMDLTTKSEKRITYQDGDVYEGSISPDGQFVFYTSTTDEIKERPILFYPELKSEPFPTTEIYRIKPDDDLHERWSQHPGFDGFIHTYQEPGKGLAIAQSRWVGSDLQLFRSLGTKPNFETFTSKKSGQWTHSFTTHYTKPWKAWIQENSITGSSQIILQKGTGNSKESLEIPLFEIRDLQFANQPNSGSDKDEVFQFIFTARSEKTGHRKAYWLNMSEKCKSGFLPSAAEVTGLRVSPDGTTLAWTLGQGNQSQIFMGLLDRGPKDCEPLQSGQDIEQKVSTTTTEP